MEENITENVASIKHRIYEVEDKKLFRIFKETPSATNTLAINLYKLISLIDNNDFICSRGLKPYLIDILAKGASITRNTVRILMLFLKSEGYIKNINNVIRLTEEGFYLKFADKDYVSMLLFKYFWEKANLNEISPFKEKSIFLEKESRRLIALLILEMNRNNKYFKRSNILIYKELGIEPLVYEEDLFSNKSVKYILKNIFEAMGIVKFGIKNKELSLKLTTRGTKILENYGNEMIEEYTKLTEESWECYDRGNFEQAGELAKNILSLFPNNVEAYNIMGCVFIRKNDYEKAKNTFIHAINLYKEKMEENINLSYTGNDPYISLNYNLGLCLFYNGDLMNSLKVLKRIKGKGIMGSSGVEEMISYIKMIVLKGGSEP